MEAVIIHNMMKKFSLPNPIIKNNHNRIVK